MVYGWAGDPLLREAGDSGGFVTGLLYYLLSSGAVDAVSVVRQGADIYDAGMVIITDPEELWTSSGVFILWYPAFCKVSPHLSPGQRRDENCSGSERV